LLVLTATLGGAEAQTAGSPLPLLQIDHAKAAAHAHHKAARIARTKSAEKTAHGHIARRVRAKTRIADAGRDLPAPPQTAPPQTAPQNDAQNIWSAPAATVAGNAAAPSGSSLPSGVTPDAPAAAPAATVVNEPVVDTDPNGILNGGHAVPVAMPNPAKSAASAPTPAVAQPPAPTPSAPVKMAAAGPATPKPAVRAMLVKPSTPSPVGSASWIAQMFAALGGAIAAGAVAWFLIRPAPERNYG
jgi:hypothetical protein